MNFSFFAEHSDFSDMARAGMQVKLPNGYTLSIVAGTGSYSAGDDVLIVGDAMRLQADTVETAIIDPNGKVLNKTVGGWQDPETVAMLLHSLLSGDPTLPDYYGGVL